MVGRHSAGGGALGPAVAGTWYPAEGAALERQLGGFFRDASAEPTSDGPSVGRIRALIAPHAGFVYSGRVAARGFSRLGDGPYDRVILLGPSHYAPFEGALLPEAAVYRTPLGEVPIDAEACQVLLGCEGYRANNQPFQPEHCLEAEIPFLQHRLRVGWRLVPILVGMLGPRADATRLANGLRPLLGPGTLVVISTDFTHYGPRFDYMPFQQDVERRLEQLDMGAVERILEWDAEGFESYVARTGATICGRHPIRVLLELFPEGLTGRLAAYDTSGHITGEWDHSVSYASLVFEAEA